ncbi:tautomerase family protein [Methylibium sp.]|uniref:tautomerase family protein n=1 Tax=Methylibium sp. TaxID=2067992 RepID=UPI003D1436C9
MPLVTITVRKPKTAAFKSAVFNAVHEALVAAGVPATDRFQRALELDEEDFRFDPSYPDLKSERNADFVLVEVLFSVGRSVKIKKKIVHDILATLSREGFDPENVMICFKETAWENWVFGGGRFIHT